MLFYYNFPPKILGFYKLFCSPCVKIECVLTLKDLPVKEFTTEQLIDMVLELEVSSTNKAIKLPKREKISDSTKLRDALDDQKWYIFI